MTARLKRARARLSLALLGALSRLALMMDLEPLGGSLPLVLCQPDFKDEQHASERGETEIKPDHCH